MSSNIINRQPYIRTSREFPEQLHEMSVEVNKAYIDIANAVNDRIIGIFPTNRPAITGEKWFLNKRGSQQTLRQLYQFTTTANIPHGINTGYIGGFTDCYGQFTDGTNFYGLISASNVAIPGQISFYMDNTNIIFVLGAGAPTLTSGTIVLEWLAQV